MTDSLEEILENEWFLVRYSGETPEIAFHSALYYLTRAKDGPKIQLTKELQNKLLGAAMERFQEIILRDLLHTNSGKPNYRGICRSIVNYRRFIVFCERQNLDCRDVKNTAAETLRVFLNVELSEVISGKRASIINCTKEQLLEFAAELGVDLGGKAIPIGTFCLSRE